MGKYSTTVYLGMVDGKQKNKKITASSQRELKRKVLQAQMDVLQKKDCYSDATFGIWAEKWMQEVVLVRGVSEGTRVQYESAIRHLNERFEKVRLDDIHLEQFQRFILNACNSSTGKPLSKSSLKTLKNVGASVFKYARANNVANVPDFFEAIQIPKTAPQKKRDALTEDQISAVLNTEHRCQPLAVLLLFTGLRLGEAIALEWSDIDFLNKRIRVNKSADTQKNSPEVKQGGKTRAATRTIPLPDYLASYLKDYRSSRSMISRNVITDTRGRMLSKSAYRKMWEAYIQLLNREYVYKDVPEEELQQLPLQWTFTAYNLRHTYATLLYLQKVDVREASQYMGHSSIAITLDIYTDLENYGDLLITDDFREKLQKDYLIKSA